MNLAILTALPMLMGAPAAPVHVGLGSVSPTVQVTVQDDAFTELQASFELAKADWKQKLKDVDDLRERAALRENHPAKQFWPRFEAQAEAGTGQAMLWMVGNAKDAGTPRNELSATKQRLYGALVEKHVAEPWFGSVVSSLSKEKRYLDAENRDALLAGVMNAESAPAETRAHATFAMGSLMSKSKDEDTVARGKALLASIAEKFPDTTWALKAQSATVTAADLKPGKPAPNFVGETIDGHNFKLSDDRGKVVLVDFYGFW